MSEINQQVAKELEIKYPKAFYKLSEESKNVREAGSTEPAWWRLEK